MTELEQKITELIQDYAVDAPPEWVEGFFSRLTAKFETQLDIIRASEKRIIESFKPTDAPPPVREWESCKHLWIKTSERLPTEKDADCNGNIWAFYKDRSLLIINWRSNHMTHWAPTGLTRPEPPAKPKLLEVWINEYKEGPFTERAYVSTSEADEFAGADRIRCVHMREVEE